MNVHSQFLGKTAIADDIQVAFGHSFGKLVAAAVCCAISFQTALGMVISGTNACLHLEQHIWTKPMGMMLFGGVPKATLEFTVEGAAEEFVVTGAVESIEKVSSILKEEGATCHWIESDIPFHSPFVADVAEAVEQSFNSTRWIKRPKERISLYL